MGIFGEDKRAYRKVTVTKVERGGVVITYRVHIGAFIVHVLMLNLNCSSSLSAQKVIAKGNCGDIVTFEAQVVAKRYNFRKKMKVLRKPQSSIDWTLLGTYDEVCEMVIEFAFNKICSILKIGPKVGSPSHGFDMVCFNDCIDYYMEKCQPCVSPPEGYPLRKVERRLKYCVRVMHILKIMHKDIKPANILYSNSWKDLVLTDFGVSTPIAEELGQKTKTYGEGTPNYMSPEMLGVRNGGM